MRTITKIILIVVVFFVGALVIALIGQASGHTKGGGPIGIIIMFGLIAAIRAIWKYKPQERNTSIDNQALDKNNPS